MVEIPSFITGLVAGLIFSALISPLIFDAFNFNLVCENVVEPLRNTCWISKNLLWFAFFALPPIAGLAYALKRGR